MTPDKKIIGTPDAWENGDLGRDEGSVKRSPPEREKAVEEALDLQLISIRLQKALIEDLKFIAHHHGIGYQPLVRDVLGRFTRSEMSDIAHEMAKKTRAKQIIKESAAAAGQPRRKRA